MSFMFETYLKWPSDPLVERSISQIAERHGGFLEYRHEMCFDGANITTVELTFEFADEASATAAEQEVQKAGHHTEGVAPYGDD